MVMARKMDLISYVRYIVNKIYKKREDAWFKIFVSMHNYSLRF
jgi:hypothetical protein